MNQDDRDLLIKIANAEVLNGGWTKLSAKVDRIGQDLNEFKFQTSTEQKLIKIELQAITDDVNEIQKDVREIKRQISDPSSGLIVKSDLVEKHIQAVEQIAGPQLVDLSDSIRSFKLLKRYMIAVFLATSGTVAIAVKSIVESW